MQQGGQPLQASCRPWAAGEGQAPQRPRQRRAATAGPAACCIHPPTPNSQRSSQPPNAARASSSSSSSKPSHARPHLAHVLGLGHLLADDGLLVARVVAGAPAEHGVGPVGDVALPPKLNLRRAWAGSVRRGSGAWAATIALLAGAAARRRACARSPAACAQTGWGPGTCCTQWGSRCAPTPPPPASGATGRVASEQERRQRRRREAAVPRAWRPDFCGLQHAAAVERMQATALPCS